MLLNLRDYKLKINSHIYMSIYMNFTITMNQKPTMNTQKVERKESEHNTLKESMKPQSKKPKEKDRNKK